MSTPTQPQVNPPHGWLQGLAPWLGRSGAQIRRNPITTALCLLIVLGGVGVVGYYFGYRYVVARDHYASAQQALELDNFDTAIQELNACLELRHDHAAAHFLLARTLRRAEKLTEIDKHLAEAERLKWPVDDIALEMLLIGAQMQGPKDEELRFLASRLQARSPDEPVILEALTLGYFRHNRLPEAYNWLTHWATHYPQDWRPYLRRGTYFFVTGALTRAREDYETVLRLRPDHPVVRRWLGLTHLKSNYKLDEAITYLTAYVAEHPEDAEALDSLARCQRLEGKGEAAQATLDRLFRRQREFAGAYLTRAQLEADANRPEAALQALQQFQIRSATNIEDARGALVLAGRLYRQLNRAAEAREVEDRLERFKKELETVTTGIERFRKGERSVEVARQIGAAYLWMGLEAEGKRWLQSVLQQNPNDEATRRILSEHAARTTGPSPSP
jgi:tetratricopeptide (TPR) repeat protein